MHTRVLATLQSLFSLQTHLCRTHIFLRLQLSAVHVRVLICTNPCMFFCISFNNAACTAAIGNGECINTTQHKM